MKTSWKGSVASRRGIMVVELDNEAYEVELDDFVTFTLINRLLDMSFIDGKAHQLRLLQTKFENLFK
jgi:hypothetical protein